MPFKKRITDVQQSIDDTLAEISKLRNDGAGKGDPEARAKVEKLLATIARLRAERLRLMGRQSVISN
jgi:hypothetical protein